MSEMFEDREQPAGKDDFMPSLPVMVRLVEKRRETPGIVSLLFELPPADSPSFRPAQNIPGQFVMVWLPGLNEKPFVISYLTTAGFGITVMVRGNFSRRLAELKEGEMAGFRGPFGRGYSRYNNYQPEKIAILGGGCGMAPLALLAQAAPDATLIQGAPSARNLLYLERFPQQIACTEDGSYGIKGTPLQWLEGRVAEEFDVVYTCGPEPFLKAVVSLCLTKGIACQAALERYMKCAVGICGQCECDGRLVCRDGPVFDGTELAAMPSFGHFRRDAAGRRVSAAAGSPVAGCSPQPSRTCNGASPTEQ